MKKLILSIIIGVLIAFSSHADEKLNQGSWWEQVPAICISNESLWNTQREKKCNLLMLVMVEQAVNLMVK